jgi:hypothetical protein
MATQSFTLTQLDRLPTGYLYSGGNELLLTSVASGANYTEWRTLGAEVSTLSSYYVPQTEYKADKAQAGQVAAYGTFYLNGDTRERIWSLPTDQADIVRGSLEVDATGVSYNKYLHSGNIYVDTKYNKIYFCRGTYPRVQGLDSNDKDGWTWRELGGQGEAILRCNLDGTGIEVVKDLSNGGPGYYDPCAVAFDDVHDYVFFACRCDHGQSAIYRMDRDGSNLVTWARMATDNVNIDCLDIAHVPQDFFAANYPACTTTYLYFGISPDYNKVTNTKAAAHAAILRLPVIGTAPGVLTDDYTSKYCIHRFWHSSYKDDVEGTSANPNMDTTGIKGIKVFISNNSQNDLDPNWWSSEREMNLGFGYFGKPGNINKQWLPTMSKEAVSRSASRIYVVHSGARNAKRDPTEITTTGSGATPPTAPDIPDIPNIHTIEPTHIGHGFGGNSIFELLVGEPYGPDLAMSAQHDADRDYKTWREGDLFISGDMKVINMGNDDPGKPVGDPGSGPGAARNTAWATGDHLYVSTSPTQSSYYNQSSGSLDGKSGRGVRKIVGALNGNYSLAGTDGTADGPGEVGKVMVIPVIASTLADVNETGMRSGGHFGLRDITINPCTNELFFTDFWTSSYYLLNTTFQQQGGALQPSIAADPDQPFIPADPPNQPIAGNPPNAVIPGHAYVPAVAAIAAGPYNPYSPGRAAIPATLPTGGNPGQSPIAGTVGDPTIPFEAGDPLIPIVPAGAGVSYRITQPDDSYYGTIYRADAFYYCRYKNGQHLFNRFSHIGYNRPCGIGGYNVGPWNEFRLVYTNGETQLLTPTSLTDDTYTELLAARGREVNGLSQVFTRHNVLASGKNVFAIHDYGFGTFNGLLITFQNEMETSDYAVIAQASNGDLITVPTLHHQDMPAAYRVTHQANTSMSLPGGGTNTFLVDDPSMYQAKNKRQFRICYPDKITALDSLPYSLYADPRTVNTIFFAVLQ